MSSEEEIMSAIKVMVRDRRIELSAPEEIPDGTEVLVDVTPVMKKRIGIDESEWRDDPESIADWEAWIKSFEPLEFTADELAGSSEFDSKMREYDLKAVRRKMTEMDWEQE